MGRRPLCLVALLFVLWVLGTQAVFPQDSAGGTEREEQGMSSGIRPGERIRVRGEIYRYEKKQTDQIYLKNISILSGTNQTSYDFNVILFLEEQAEYQIGNILEAAGVCQIPESAANPGQFDMAKWYESQGVAFSMSRCRVRLADGRQNRLGQGISQVRQRLSESFGRIADRTEAALMSAMLLGDKGGLDEEIKTLYQDAGISHVLAISGLHISMLGMLLFGMLRKLGCSFAGAGMMSGGLMGLYCMMAGMGTSTVRAYLMFLIYLGSQIFGRTYDLKSSLSLAVILMLFSEPSLLFQGGFQLSVLAVAGLAFVYPPLKKCFSVKGKLADSLCVAFSVQAALFPCLLYHFYQFSAAGFFLNLLILPAMSCLLLVGAAGGLAGLVSARAGMLIFAPCHYLLKYMEFLSSFSLKLPGARQIWGRPGLPALVVYYGILVSFVIFLEIRKKAGKGALVLWGLFMACGVAGLSVRRVQGMEMVFLDVGQGDGIFWQTEDGTSFLCDGGSSSVSEVGKYRIIPFLKHRGIRRLDCVFLTHMDADHINGVLELLEGDAGIAVGALALPDLRERDDAYRRLLRLAEAKGISVLYFRRGMELRGGNWRIRCLSPEAGAEIKDPNEGSLVLSVDYGNFRALLTGDLQGRREELLIRDGSLEKLSVLKAAHHGSKNSTPALFLERTSPRAAIISCSRDNSYGHPSPELLGRLKDSGAAIHQTMEQGALTVRTDGTGFTVEGYR